MSRGPDDDAPSGRRHVPKPQTGHPELSVVVPALNERDNLPILIDEIDGVVRQDAGVAVEVIVVDDGSSDGTADLLRGLQASRPWLVTLQRGRSGGQSAAMAAGVHVATGAYVAFLDADCQNDPADLPRMLAEILRGGADLVQGDRTAARKDSRARRAASRVGRAARRLILADRVRDTGCSARVLTLDLARSLPLQFRGMHRFIPAYATLVGARVTEMPVRHRPRHAGTTKYGVGVFSRGVAGLIDCLAVRWMAARHRDTSARRVR